MSGRKPLIRSGAPLAERLAALLDKSSSERGCWLWLRGVDKDGYGKIQARGRTIRAHRLALELRLGRPVVGLVLHSCDTPRCCNPDHLSEGTQLLNRREAVERGRTARGLRVGNGRIPDAAIRNATALHVLGLRPRDIAKAIGVPVADVYIAVHTPRGKAIRAQVAA